MSYILDALNKQESDGQAATSAQTQSADQPSRYSWLPIVGLALLANAIVAGVWLWQGRTPDTVSTTSATASPVQIDRSPAAPSSNQPSASTGSSSVVPSTAAQGIASDEQSFTTFDDMATPMVEPLIASRPASQPEPAMFRPSNTNEQLTITTQPGEVVISPPGSRPNIIEATAVAGEPTEPPVPAGSFANRDTAAVAASTPVAAAPEPIEQPPSNAGAFITFAELDGATRARFPEIEVSTHIYAEEADLRAVVFERRRLQEGDTIAGLPLVHITEAGLVVRFEGQLIELSVLDDWEGY